jgi:hypothetical protein
MESALGDLADGFVLEFGRVSLLAHGTPPVDSILACGSRTGRISPLYARREEERMIRPSLIWSVVAVVYIGFFAWYTGVRGPLTPDEIDYYMARLAERNVDLGRRDDVRKFLEEDTGGDLAVVNLILFHENPPAVEGVPAGESSAELLDRYMAYMWPALLSRACHSLIGGRAAARAVEMWGIEGAEEWGMGAFMRYRSRRDLMEISTDPAFDPAHVFKIAAIEKTIAFPADPYFILGGARLVVGLLLFALGAVLHLTLGRRRARGGGLD